MLIDLGLLGRTAEAVLASLQRLDIDYFIWNRGESRPQDWRSTLLSTPFLRTHTRILAGDRSGYLFELLPQGGSDWGQSQPNLLADPGLEHVGTDGPWRVTEPVRTRKGVVLDCAEERPGTTRARHRRDAVSAAGYRHLRDARRSRGVGAALVR